jgi:type I restriction-modification system DNA methylase subunit
MASRKKGIPHPTSAFAQSILSIAHRVSLYIAFDDFLTMAIAAVTQNPGTKLSWYEGEYLQAMEKYKTLEVRHEFPNAFASLIMEMEDRVTDQMGNDVLGEFFETHISNGHNGQFFTPYHVCLMMASFTGGDTTAKHDKPQRVIDPTCGSGRMLLASSRVLGPGHEYYGVDIDATCIKMAALNLFLNGVWISEVMCANALSPFDFRFSYHTSFFPLGIFKIEDKEKSRLWHLYNASFKKKGSEEQSIVSHIQLSGRQYDGSQLNLFEF